MVYEYYSILLEIRIRRLPPNVTSSTQIAQAHTLIGFILEKLN